MVTQVLVDRNDPALQNPSKPIGSFYKEDDARVKMAQEGWSMVEDAGRGWRRVVPSPVPQEIIERDAIETLLRMALLSLPLVVVAYRLCAITREIFPALRV